MQMINQGFEISSKYIAIKELYNGDPLYFIKQIIDSQPYLLYLKSADVILSVILFVFFFQFASRVKKMTYFTDSKELSNRIHIASTLVTVGIIFGVSGYVIDVVSSFVNYGSLLYLNYLVDIVTSIIFALAFFRLAQFMRGCYQRGIMQKRESSLLIYSQLIAIVVGVLLIISGIQFVNLNTGYLLWAIVAITLSFISSTVFIWGLYKFYFNVKDVQSSYDSIGDNQTIGESHRAPSSMEVEPEKEIISDKKETKVSRLKKKDQIVKEEEPTQKTIACPNCGKETDIQSKFCMHCVSEISK